MTRRVIDIDALGRRRLDGELTRVLAAEIGWQTESLHKVFQRHGYGLSDAQVRARQAENGRIVGTNCPPPGRYAREPDEQLGAQEIAIDEAAPPIQWTDRTCLHCERPFNAETRFIRRCGSCLRNSGLEDFAVAS